MAGNWKMYKDPAATALFFEKLLPLVAHSTHCDIVVCPPFVNIAAAVAATRGTEVAIGAQNLHHAKEGAFTGEISATMLKAAGCRAVIVGHSERRHFFGETDESVFKKTVAALDAGLQPIVCVGERLEEREAGRTNQVLETQFRNGLSQLTPQQLAQIVIAYEPVWAIGTGKVATPEQAADAHRFLRSHVPESVRIIYGGSVKPDNIKGLMAQPEIDGALVGGASLDPYSFASLVNWT